MKLTGKELEIMTVLWNSGMPLTTAEIIETSPNRTWQEGSIYSITKSLIKKGAAVLDTCNYSRTYKPIITTEQYALSTLVNMEKKGLKFDIDVLVDALLKTRQAGRIRQTN